MNDRERGETIQIEVPKEALDRSEGYLCVIFDPMSSQQVARFQEWVGASGFDDDVWLLLNTENGEVEEKYV